MADSAKISQALRELVLRGKQSIDNLIICTVVSVDGVTCVCQPLDEDEAEINARLASENSDSLFLLTPSIDSIVGLIPFDDSDASEYLVVLYSAIESIKLRGDQFGGLIKIEELVDKINTIEDKVNDIINAYNAHTHPETGSTTSPTTSLIVGTITNTTVNDLENENVQHG